jgi:sn-glycerol 3-phosphate transport system substrate-binding protein
MSGRRVTRVTRRAFGVGSSLAALGALGGTAGCKRALRDDRGRVRLRLWFSLGGRNREVLLEIVKRFHAVQDDIHVEPVYQGDYFESLAKLRTAIAAKAAPALSHVVAEVVPYLARAGTLQSLDGYTGKPELPLVAPHAPSGA